MTESELTRVQPSTRLHTTVHLVHLLLKNAVNYRFEQVLMFQSVFVVVIY